MALRQTDALYKLSHKADGTWDLKFDRFWQNEKIKVLPPLAMNATTVNGGAESVKPSALTGAGLITRAIHFNPPSERNGLYL
jgi:hypothetical protein